MAEDYGVSLKITADTSDLDKIPQKVDETKAKIEQPVAQTVEAKVSGDTSDAIGKFNALRAMTAALHGNFTGLSVVIAKLGSGMGALGSIGVGGFFAIGAAIMGVVKLATALRDLFATIFNVGQVGRDITSIGNSLGQIKNQAEQFADAMNDARKASELVNQSLEKEIAALGRVAKAQNEINRQRELSGAKSDEERDAINTKYDRQSIDIGSDTARQTEELKRKGIVDEIARLEQEIEQSKKTQAAYEDQAAMARAKARSNTLLTTDLQQSKPGTVFAGVQNWADSIASGITGRATFADRARAASESATNAQNAADDEAERRAELEEKLEKARHELKNADLEAEARKAEDSAAREKNAQDAATKAAQKDEKDQRAQRDYTEARDRRTADADFDARFRAAQRRASAPDATEAQRNEAENTQLEMLRGKEDAAKAELEAAERELAEEMAKEAKDRDEDRMARARERAARAQGEQISAAREREDISAQIENRRVSAAQDYFGNLARQVDASRPQNRLTAMGLGSGGPADSTGREQVSLLKEIAKDFREAISAIRANKPGDGTALYAP